ncbi:MAG: GerMN domain-containing protein [Thermodesulfobacteriota bacterium]
MLDNPTESTFHRHRVPILLLSFLAFVLITCWILFAGWSEGPPPPALPSTKTVELYFSAEGGKRLKIEEREIEEGDRESELSAIIEALIKGSSTGLGPVTAEGTRLIGVSIDGTLATVDFSAELVENHWGGSSAELQTVYGVVNSITRNFDEIDSVQILVEGEKRGTLKGHIRINAPLGFDKEWGGGQIEEE